MQARTCVPSRAGLAGNPSDGYGGRALAVTISNFEAWVEIEPSRHMHLESAAGGRLELSTPLPAPGGPHRLAIASCRRFFSAALSAGWLAGGPVGTDGFHLRYGSTIPVRVGLAGSSALAIAILRALAARYGVSIPEPDLPSLALAVETEELGIHGGLMDRVTQAVGGLVYMDLSEDLVRTTGRGRCEPLPAGRLPALYVAWIDELAIGSEAVHNDLRQRFDRGEAEVLAVMADLAGLADEARNLILADLAAGLPDLMDANFELRTRLMDVGDGNRRLVEIGRSIGAGVKQTGSGEPGRLSALRKAYETAGAGFVVPNLDPEPTGGSTGA
jgi:glucuronokinase